MTSGNMESSAIDLSIRAGGTTGSMTTHSVPIIKPIPRLPWTTTWYQTLWANNQSTQYLERLCKNVSHLNDNESKNEVGPTGEEQCSLSTNPTEMCVTELR